MRPSAWHPSVEASPLEQTIITCIKRAKLFVFLRHHRHEIFDDAFQEELATLYGSSLRELRQGQQTPEGRAKLRERVAVEHTLAHVGRWQGRARYRGQRKNPFDLRRCAVVHNLHVLARSQVLQADLQEAA